MYPNHMPQILRLTASDTQRLHQLNAMFARAFEDPDTYATHPPSDTYAARALAQEHVIVLVAIVDDTVVGGLVAYELDKLERERREVYIYDLAVEAHHRRQGIATALIQTLREIATKRDAWVIYVQADYGDDPAVALYTKLGVREDVMHFDIRVA
jgi:aminoglycoside 3-N-acetyltransferase I